MEFRSASGDIQYLYFFVRTENFQAFFHSSRGHAFASLRGGADMTMSARLVALPGYVYLHSPDG
jgi:hypothetical protein